MSFFSNLLIPLLPVGLILVIWRLPGLALAAPGLLHALLVVADALIGPDSALLPGELAHKEWFFYLTVAVLLGLAMAFVLILSARGYSWVQISLSQTLLVYTWVCIWYMANGFLTGGKGS